MKPSVSFFLALVTASGVAAQARADDCPEARSLRLAGALPEAEAAARRCLEEDREDVGSWFELSRALGLQRRFAPALEWVERGLERYPEDLDLALWQVRLLAWSGQLARARTRLDAITRQVPEVLRDRETAMLAADIPYWSHDWTAADQGFSTYLASWPDDRLALLKRGIVRDERARHLARIELRIEPSLASGGLDDELATRLTVTARVWNGLRLGAAAELRHRDGAGTEASVYGLLRWQGERLAVEGALGGGLGEVGFTPELSAWIEPSVRLARPVWAALRYWRLDFATGGAHVLSPGLTVALGKVELDLRYWLGINDRSRSATAGSLADDPTTRLAAAGALGDEQAPTSHAGLLRVRWTLAPSWTVEAGGGLGNAADYLQPKNGEVSGHWLGLLGVRLAPGWRHRLSAGYVQRHESSGATSHARHEVTLGWQVAL